MGKFGWSLPPGCGRLPGEDDIPEWYTTAANNARALFRYFGADNWGQIYRALYKGTACGVTVGIALDGAERPVYCDHLYQYDIKAPVVEVHISSIVEGVDYGTDTHILNLAVRGTRKTGNVVKRLFALVQLVEDEARAIWDETHGCEVCAAHWQDTGLMVDWDSDYVPVWPECPDCKGAGAII